MLYLASYVGNRDKENKEGLDVERLKVLHVYRLHWNKPLAIFPVAKLQNIAILVWRL